MQRLFLIFTLLLVSVLSTACINNLAVQQLNTKAKEYMNAGDVQNALCRYRSSLDLDPGIFETNYNLGVAYIEAKEYSNAVEVLKNAIKINSTFADGYYSLGVALENEAYAKKTEYLANDEKNSVNAIKSTIKKELTTEQKEEIFELLNESIENYKHYLTLSPDASDKEEISSHIEKLNSDLGEYSSGEAQTDDED